MYLLYTYTCTHTVTHTRIYCVPVCEIQRQDTLVPIFAAEHQTPDEVTSMDVVPDLDPGLLTVPRGNKSPELSRQSQRQTFV